MSTWKTHRGDEWWYEGTVIRASAGRAAGIVSIDEIVAVKGFITEPEFHAFLLESMSSFNGERILVSLASPKVESLMQALSASGVVAYDVMASAYSKEAKVLSVRPAVSTEIALTVSKKKWWSFW